MNVNTFVVHIATLPDGLRVIPDSEIVAFPHKGVRPINFPISKLCGEQNALVPFCGSRLPMKREVLKLYKTDAHAAPECHGRRESWCRRFAHQPLWNSSSAPSAFRLEHQEPVEQLTADLLEALVIRSLASPERCRRTGHPFAQVPCIIVSLQTVAHRHYEKAALLVKATH